MSVPNGQAEEGDTDQRGRAYLIYGPVTEGRDLSDSDVILEGEDAGDGAGRSVSLDGDVDGDGYSDVMVGCAGKL